MLRWRPLASFLLAPALAGCFTATMGSQRPARATSSPGTTVRLHLVNEHDAPVGSAVVSARDEHGRVVTFQVSMGSGHATVRGRGRLHSWILRTLHKGATVVDTNQELRSCSRYEDGEEVGYVCVVQ